MTAFRHFDGEWSLLAFCALGLVAAALIGVSLWARRRERRGDWGPGLVGVSARPGFSPADLRASAPGTPIASEEDRRLLGLAAPFVEQTALLHDRWSLVPAFCDEQWRRRLLAVANSWGAVRASGWKRRVRALEAELAAEVGPAAGPAAQGLTARGSTEQMPTEQGSAAPQRAPENGALDPRPYLVAVLAMQLRLGVALRHTSAPRARARLSAAASEVLRDYDDWLAFGDAFLARAGILAPAEAIALRADLRMLYAPDGPWRDASLPG